MPNEIEIDYDDDFFYCRPCNREFLTDDGLFQHCAKAKVHVGEWCGRCTRLFAHPAARAQHLNNSSEHHVCETCGIDYISFDLKLQHLTEVHFRCDMCGVLNRSKVELNSHRVKSHWPCRTCGRLHNNINERDYHEITHIPRNLECFGCTQTFHNYSAMMIHLESGTCPSDVDQYDLHQWAHECYQSAEYTTDFDDFPFCCPECGVTFRYISALFQHIESKKCSQGYSGPIAKLKHYISIRV